MKKIRNSKGQFIKGFTPWNKGKRGVYFLTKEHKEKIKKGVIKKASHTLFQKGHSDLVPLKSRKKAGKKTSKVLKGKYMRENSSNWRGGKSFEPYSPAWTSTLRQAVRERDKYICQLCDIYPAFCVHHIDYDKKNCEPENLIILCAKCNSKVNFDRKYWLNYFNGKKNIHKK